MIYEQLKEEIIRLLDDPVDDSTYQNLQDIEMLIDDFFIEADE